MSACQRLSLPATELIAAKILGVVLRHWDYRDEASFAVRNHLIKGELVFFEVALQFVRILLHMTPAWSC